MIDILNGKKIAMLGLGVNHKSLAEFLTKKGVAFEVLENWTDPLELDERLKNFDFIFRTPGVPFMSPVIQNALKRGTAVYSQTKLFFDLCPCPIIGVTGTKGKGTTSSLIYGILKAADKNVYLAGNIGKDPFDFLDELKNDDLVVLELSSFQLQDLHKSPHIAVVLNITEDHVNPALKMSTHYSKEEYVNAKSSIIKFQTESDFAILNPHVPPHFKELGLGQKIFVDPESVKNLKTNLLGAHNRENIAPAVEVAKILNIPTEIIADAVASFEPLPHRLQYQIGQDGITYVNDSLSTNEDSTIAAIQAFEKPLVLILGGSDKGHSYQKLADEIASSPRVKGLVLIGDVAEKIKSKIKHFNGPLFTGAKTMAEIISQARTIAQSGDVILLSPAAASFGLFKDAKERGSLFMSEAQK